MICAVCFRWLMEDKAIRYVCLALSLFISSSATQGAAPPTTAPKGKQSIYPKSTIPLWALLLSAEDNDALPRRFRSTWDRIPETFERTGMSALKMAGSGQFSASQFKSSLNYIGNFGISPNQVVVVDLREEPHAFINGHAVRWYAAGAWWTQGNPVSLVIEKEKECLSRLSLGQSVFVRFVQKDKTGSAKSLGGHSYVINSLETEEEIVAAAGAHYIRLPVTDHMKPEDKDVDQFLGLVKKLPPQACVYFHCHAGRGRTSTFMIMYDMIRNPKLPREAIIDRQVQLGSRDLRRLSGSLKSHKHSDEKARLQFIHLFYEYVNAPDGYGKTSWTKWIAQRHALRKL